MIKERKDTGIYRDKKEKATKEKNNNKTWGNKPEITSEWKRIKETATKRKKYRQNRTSQNIERKFYQQLVGDDTKTFQQPDAKETERFWTKIW